MSTNRNDALEARFDSDELDTEALRVTRVVGREAIGELFHFDLDLVSLGGSPLERSAVLGALGRLVLVRGGLEQRAVHGMVWSLDEDFDFAGGHTRYRVRLVPRAARLALVETQDIFQARSVPDILYDKLRAVEIEAADVNRTSLLASYPARDFVTQFGESDLAFLCRWCEHLGISFFFEHVQGTDRIVLTDAPVGFGAFEGCPSLSLGARADAPEQVRALRAESEVMPEQYWVMDYDYRQPDLELTCSHTSALGLAGGVFEYGGHFRSLDDGRQLARVRAEERECLARRYRGESDVCRVSAGHRYELDGHPELDGRKLLVVAVDHELVQSAGGSAVEPHYLNRFTAVPAEQPYRPPRRTPRPRIPGLLTGVVEPREHGKTEDPACLDELGRYTVKFLYDTAPLGEAKASKPIRMALPSAGPRAGIHFPLRPGVEVVLGFVNGDPDRPIIVGALHNAKVVPHVVDANQQVNTIETTSGIRMRFKDTLQRR
ncbi:MAG: type VI secretion system tip protein VgrG [Myxococcales bacterium]|nr:type VI secretion system tip protein VgrG [Myxococcales bacterium]